MLKAAFTPKCEAYGSNFFHNGSYCPVRAPDPWHQVFDHMGVNFLKRSPFLGSFALFTGAPFPSGHERAV
jgi:hypothetical protein